jgi:hypothetical protein
MYTTPKGFLGLMLGIGAWAVLIEIVVEWTTWF